MGNSLAQAQTVKHTQRLSSSTGIEVGSTGMQGWRTEMEDTHVSVDMPSQPDHVFLAVFDGHGGSETALIAANKIVNIFEQSVNWKKYLEKGATDFDLIALAFRETYLNIDDDLKKRQQIKSLSKEEPVDMSGCTAVSAIITPTHIICANAGDSRCVMGIGRNKTKFLSEDHKPNNPLEISRIENSGGFVRYNRVQGDLALSRAFGDFRFKDREDLSEYEQMVTALPDIIIHERSPLDDILILACDGLWDVMSNEECIAITREIFLTGENDMGLVAEELVDLSFLKGSRDNISATVAKLPGAKFGPKNLGGVTQRRRQRAAENKDIDRSSISSPDYDFDEEIEVTLNLNEADDEDVLFSCTKKNLVTDFSLEKNRRFRESKGEEEIVDFDLDSLI